jgi:hypothetical protein
MVEVRESRLILREKGVTYLAVSPIWHLFGVTYLEGPDVHSHTMGRSCAICHS